MRLQARLGDTQALNHKPCLRVSRLEVGLGESQPFGSPLVLSGWSCADLTLPIRCDVSQLPNYIAGTFRKSILFRDFRRANGLAFVIGMSLAT